MIATYSFSNTDLDVDYIYKVDHGLGKSDLIVKWYDPDGFEQNTGGILKIVDDDNVWLYCNDLIAAGDHTLQIYYESTLTGSAKRLFELSNEASIVDTMRFALGKASTPAVNITWATLKSLLFSVLGFAKKSANLSDMNATTCRNNLGVYSKTEVDNENHLQTYSYQAPGSGVTAYALSTINTLKFLPTAAYHPATYSKVLNMGFMMIYAGSFDYGPGLTTIFKNTDILTGSLSGAKDGDDYVITHNLGSTSYFVIATPRNTTSTILPIKTGQIYKAANSFKICFGDDNTKNDTDFDFFMFQIPTYIAD